MNSNAERFFITGGLGCIGAWAVRNLIQEGAATVVFDRSTDLHRLEHILTPEEIDRVEFIQGDIVELSSVERALSETGATHILHLAALQVPLVNADPAGGAAVNVVGTVNVLEAARRLDGQVRGLAYASSIAALGPPEMYPDRPVPDEVASKPETLYGVFKRANEGTASLYWQNWGVASVGFRPHTVYGVGRDQGLTSDPTKAILAAAAGRPFTIKFGGQIALQHAGDVARIFIQAARAQREGSQVFNLRNDVILVETFVEKLKSIALEAEVAYTPERPLPFPSDMDDSGLRGLLGTVPHTPLEEGIRQTLDRFRSLVADRGIDLGQLEA